MSAPLDSGARVYATATHATAAAAIIAAVAGQKIYITDVTMSSDKAGAIALIKDGSTVLWQVQVGAGNYEHHFQTPLVTSIGATASAEIDGTSACKANIAGVQL